MRSEKREMRSEKLGNYFGEYSKFLFLISTFCCLFLQSGTRGGIAGYIYFKSRYLEYMYYNFGNNTPQASLRMHSSPRGVTS